MNSRLFLLVLVLFSLLVISEAWLWRRRRRTPSSRNRGVTAYSIANQANSRVGSTDWSYAGCIYFRFCFANKCNLFVNDMLVKANAKVPGRKSYMYSPIGANEWGDPNSSYVRKTGCYYTVDWSSRQRGDVIAFPASRGSGHVGIVYSRSEYISAKQFEIEKAGYPNGRRRVLWRYRYTDPRC